MSVPLKPAGKTRHASRLWQMSSHDAIPDSQAEAVWGVPTGVRAREEWMLCRVQQFVKVLAGCLMQTGAVHGYLGASRAQPDIRTNSDGRQQPVPGAHTTDDMNIPFPVGGHAFVINDTYYGQA